MRRTLIPAGTLAGCLSLSAWAILAADGPVKDRPDPDKTPTRREDNRREDGRRLERGPYLGVSTAPAPAVLRRHLGLAKGVGLIVDAVAPNSPAADAGLKPDDVLHKLNDQLLVNQMQLAVVVRTLRPGDVVRLAVYRDGKPTEVSAALVERDVPPLESMRFGMPEFPFGDPRGDAVGPHPELPGWGPNGLPFDRLHPPAPGALMNENSAVAWDDGKYHLDLTVKGGRKHLTARDHDGKELYDGPVDTDEQAQALPKDVRDRLQQVMPPRPANGPASKPADPNTLPGGGGGTRPSAEPGA